MPTAITVIVSTSLVNTLSISGYSFNQGQLGFGVIYGLEFLACIWALAIICAWVEENGT